MRICAHVVHIENINTHTHTHTHTHTRTHTYTHTGHTTLGDTHQHLRSRELQLVARYGTKQLGVRLPCGLLVRREGGFDISGSSQVQSHGVLVFCRMRHRRPEFTLSGNIRTCCACLHARHFMFPDNKLCHGIQYAVLRSHACSKGVCHPSSPADGAMKSAGAEVVAHRADAGSSREMTDRSECDAAGAYRSNEQRGKAHAPWT